MYVSMLWPMYLAKPMLASTSMSISLDVYVHRYMYACVLGQEISGRKIRAMEIWRRGIIDPAGLGRHMHVVHEILSWCV